MSFPTAPSPNAAVSVLVNFIFRSSSFLFDEASVKPSAKGGHVPAGNEQRRQSKRTFSPCVSSFFPDNGHRFLCFILFSSGSIPQSAEDFHIQPGFNSNSSTIY
jgi:hypothetical protein